MSASASVPIPKTAPTDWADYRDLIIYKVNITADNNPTSVAADIRLQILSFCQYKRETDTLGHILFIAFKGDVHLGLNTAYMATSYPMYHHKLKQLLKGQIEINGVKLEFELDTETAGSQRYCPTPLNPSWPVPKDKTSQHRQSYAQPFRSRLPTQQRFVSFNPQPTAPQRLTTSSFYPPIQLPPANSDYIPLVNPYKRARAESSESIDVSQTQTSHNYPHTSPSVTDRLETMETKLDQLQETLNNLQEQQQSATALIAITVERPTLRPLGLYLSGDMSGTEAELAILDQLLEKFPNKKK